MEIELSITEEHLKKGKFRNATECPIAISLKEYNPEFEYVSTGFIGSNFRLGEDSYSIRHTPEVKDFIASFDNGKEIKPTTLYLTAKVITFEKEGE